MAGQYPGGFNNPMGGHRGPFNTQQQQQQQIVNAGAMQMGGYPGQGGIMPQQAGGMTNMGGVGGSGVMNQVGMQSPSHVQQQQQQLLQQQQQQMLQQQQMASGGSQMSMIGNIPGGTGANIMQQQMGVGGVQSQVQVAPNQMQQHGGQPTPGSNSMLAISQPNSHKEINIVALSRLGQETVQDITSRFQEIFAALKIIQPTANRDNNTEKKVQEHFRTIRLLFKRVRIIYEKCNDGYPQGMEYTHIESLIPYRDEPDHRLEASQCEEYRKAIQENQELIETVKLKNRQLREIIDRTRIIIWEINTMLSMRRS